MVAIEIAILFMADRDPTIISSTWPQSSRAVAIWHEQTIVVRSNSLRSNSMTPTENNACMIMSFDAYETERACDKGILSSVKGWGRAGHIE